MTVSMIPARRSRRARNSPALAGGSTLHDLEANYDAEHTHDGLVAGDHVK
jgi:hypothetical protein